MSTYPFERILLATEHTEFDVGAERVAFAMAKRCGVRLRAVVPIDSNPEFEVQAPELFLRGEQAAAVKIASLRVRAQEAGVELEVKVRHGMEAYREIVEEATATRTDLIVIRRRGKPGFLSNRMVGEMVSKVIRDANCCVLTVPRNAEFWQHGILASVGDTPRAQDITKLAGGIAAVCDLPLTIISIAQNQDARSKTESLNASYVDLASTLTKRVQGKVCDGDPAEQTVAVAKESAADLIVIGRQRYNLIPFVRGNASFMQRIIGATDVSTLVVPA
jgi:nucleotide-binding universal stress UspA family protein